jgi:Fe-S-cluster containining protein
MRTANQQLLQIVDAQLAEAVRRSGSHLTCHAGCAICCIGPFLVTPIDAWRLKEGLAAAPPALAAAIAERAAVASRQFAADPQYPQITLDEQALADFTQRHQNVPCPVLDPDSGVCQLYEFRPMACRTYGPPIVLDEEPLPPCPLNFTQASPEDVEAARVTIDPGLAATALVQEALSAGLPTERLLIALALR